MKWKYKYSTSWKSKDEARGYASFYRSRGYKAVITRQPNKNRYYVYIYRKKR